MHDIVLTSKEKVDENNLLLFYVDRINIKKGIKKYFNSIDKDQIDRYADLIIEYLNQFKPKFSYEIKNKYNKIQNK